MSNILYLGIYQDIITPILLFDDFDTIYAIDIIDFIKPQRQKNWEKTKKEIKQILLQGSDENTFYHRVRKEDSDETIFYLEDKCIITKEIEEPLKWTLEFYYQSKNRKLVYYLRDYQKEWPKEINGIDNILSIGAEVHDTPLIRNMFSTRTIKNYTYWALNFLHEDFLMKMMICGNNVASIIIENDTDIDKLHLSKEECVDTDEMDKYTEKRFGQFNCSFM